MLPVSSCSCERDNNSMGISSQLCAAAFKRISRRSHREPADLGSRQRDHGGNRDKTSTICIHSRRGKYSVTVRTAIIRTQEADSLCDGSNLTSAELICLCTVTSLMQVSGKSQQIVSV